MIITRLCQANLAPILKSSAPILRSSFVARPVNIPKSTLIRNFGQETKAKVPHAVRRSKTLKEQIFAPAGDTAFNLGKGVVAGGAVVGLGALCFYGLGLSSQPGALEQSVLWPQYVKDRIKSTYMYFGGSIAISVASAAAVFRTPALLELVSRGGFISMAVTLVALIGTSMVLQSIPYQPGFGAKQLAWITHSAMIGAVIAPMAFLGGPILLRAAWYTAGIVGGLSAVAVCAPSEKFLNMGGPLAIGLGVVFASSLGTMFLPPTTALGAGLYSVALYGGLLLFSGFLLYDTQRIIKSAEGHAPEGYGMVRPYDPVNMSLSIYMDAVNIFIRIATILAGGGSNRKR